MSWQINPIVIFFSLLKFYDQFNDRLLYRYIQCRSCLIQTSESPVPEPAHGQWQHAVAVRRTYCGDNGLQNLPAVLPFPEDDGRLHPFQFFLIRLKFIRGSHTISRIFIFGLKEEVRILKYHLNILTVLTQFLSLQFSNIFAAIKNFSFRRSIQRHQESHKSRFSATGFSYQSQVSFLYKISD